VRFRLFISHSNPVVAKELAEAIREVDTDGVIEVLLDAEQIVDGDDWRRRIHFLLEACHAAVVLLDDPALTSKWVLAEATILSGRRSDDQAFRLIPIYLIAQDDVTAVKRSMAEVHASLRRTSWDVVRFDELQGRRAEAPLEIAAHLLHTLKATCGLEPVRTPVERLAQPVGRLLRPGDHDALSRLASTLGPEPLHGYLLRDASARDGTRAALGLIRHLISGGPMTKVGHALRALGDGVTVEAAREVLTILQPLPFDPDAAAQLRRTGSADGTRQTWVQTADPARTVPAYIRLAHLPERPREILTLTSTHGDAATLRLELAAAYRDRFHEDDEPTDEEIALDLQDFEAYVVVPALDEATIRELEAAYPNLAFVLHHGEGDRIEFPPGATRLHPPLPEKREKDIWSAYRKAVAGLRPHRRSTLARTAWQEGLV
jgi:hypothetical protein